MPCCIGKVLIPTESLTLAQTKLQREPGLLLLENDGVPVFPHEPKPRCTAEALLEGALEEDVVRCFKRSMANGAIGIRDRQDVLSQRAILRYNLLVMWFSSIESYLERYGINVLFPSK
jgi:hypothetical protein